MTDIAIILNHWQQRAPQHLLDATRIFHGRGHTYPGLEHVCIDYFSPVLLIILYKDPGESWLQQLIDGFLAHNHQDAITSVVLQRRYLTPVGIEHLWGTPPEHPIAREHGLSYHLHFHSQNVGFFIDMQQGRDWCAQHAQGKDILNLFAYTCAFAVVCLYHGANRVVNVDMHPTSLHIGQRNLILNSLSSRTNQHFFAHDVFKSWGKLRKYGPYDIVLLDPPPNQHKHFVAEKDYPRVVRQLSSLLKPQGRVLACLNSPHLDYHDLEIFFTEQSQHWHPVSCLRLPVDFPEQHVHQGLKIMDIQWNPPSTSSENQPVIVVS